MRTKSPKQLSAVEKIMKDHDKLTWNFKKETKKSCWCQETFLAKSLAAKTKAVQVTEDCFVAGDRTSCGDILTWKNTTIRCCREREKLSCIIEAQLRAPEIFRTSQNFNIEGFLGGTYFTHIMSRDASLSDRWSDVSYTNLGVDVVKT